MIKKLPLQTKSNLKNTIKFILGSVVLSTGWCLGNLIYAAKLRPVKAGHPIDNYGQLKPQPAHKLHDVTTSQPAISYTTPQAYQQGMPISPLSPLSSYVAAPSFNNTPVAIGSAFSLPLGVAVDLAGNLYIADSGNKQVEKIAAGGNTPVVIGSGFADPVAVAVDAAGNVYVSDPANKNVKEIPVKGGTPVALGSGFSQPGGIAVDAAGNVYVADAGLAAVIQIPAGNGATNVIGTGFSKPTGVAVDVNGNVYVSDIGNNEVYMVPAGNGTVVNVAAINSPQGLSLDNAGDIFVTDSNDSIVDMVPAGGGTTLNITGNFSKPFDAVVDGAGNLFVADQLNNGIKKIVPTGGYFINTLPPGLNFNTVSGVISGTPAAVSSATYTVMAYNTSGAGSATINIQVKAPPLPALKYTTPQTFVQGTGVTPLSPTATNVAPQSFSTAPSTIGSGIDRPSGVAIDLSGNVYAVDFGDSEIKKFPAGGGTPVVVGTGFSYPQGVAVDAAGNVYVSDSNNNAVKEVQANGGAVITLGSGFSSPMGIAVDAAGNVYVADEGNKAVKIIPAGNGTVVTLGSGFSRPSGIAVDAGGNVYVGDTSDGTVKMVPANNGSIVTLGTFSDPAGLGIDGAGNIYVADEGTGRVQMVPAGGGTVVNVGPVFTSPDDVAVDGAGNVYVSDLAAASIAHIQPTGGYFINKLPVGLSFSGSGGVISGTPTMVSAAQNYTVTGYNVTGGASAVISIKVNAAPAPTIKYTTPQSLGLNIAATITPAATGVSAPGFSANKTNLATGLTNPEIVVIDNSGNVYIDSYYNNIVEKIPAGGGTPVTIGSGIADPVDITLDPAGNLFILARDGKNLIYKIAAGTGVTTSIAYSGYTNPNSIAVDAAGNLYVADIGDNSVKKSTLSSGSYGSPVIIGNNLTGPLGVALDNAGNVFVADNTDVVEIPYTSGTYGAPDTLATGFALATSIAPDIFGNLFVADFGSHQVDEIPITTGNPVTIGNGFSSPSAVAIDGKGVIYVCDEDSSNVKLIKPTGGYYLNPALPAGLFYNNATGVINGTPTALSPATTYTATAYNNYNESGTATLSIAVVNPSANDNLAALTTSVGTLSPVFAAATLNYTESVTYTSSQITVTPTAADNTATVKVNGTVVTSGSASAAITLLVGTNTINVVVTAQNGATQTYTITVTRAASTNAALAGITLSKGTLSPAFAATTTSYTDMVTNGTTSVTITPTVSNTQATVKVNGTTVKSGGASGAIALIVGSNNIPVVVTAPDGKTTETYTVNVIRPSTNAKLTSLAINAGTLSPVFNTNTTSYTANELYAQSSIKITPTVAAAGATVSINGTAVASGATSGFLILKVGANTINVVVTAQDGVTTDTYTLTVIRAVASTNSNLSAITLSKGTLTPTFAASTITYSVMETNGTTSVTLTPTTQVTTSTLRVNGVAVVSGKASGAISLAVGTNAIPVVVTAQDGNTKKTYTVNIIRPSTNAKLSNLTTNAGAVSPNFNPATTSYTLSVPNATASMTVTPTVAVTGSTVTINGVTVASGSASGAIVLSVGSNTIGAVVTAQDGVTTNTYTLTVTRATGSENIPDAAVTVGVQNFEPFTFEDGINVHQGLSPNGDGINDFLQIDNISRYPDNKLSIMNRNGQLVYEAKGYDNATKVFNGHSNKTGQMQLPGTYFYLLDYTINGIVKHKTGFLVLKY